VQTEPNDFSIAVSDEPSQEDVDAVVRGLLSYNTARAGAEAPRPLGVVVHQRGRLIGGATGVTHWRWLYISHVWVSEDARRQGVGARIVGAAEDAARRRGCRAAWLCTFSFQAPGFYRAMGYEEFGALEGFPPGEKLHFFCKSL